MAEAHADGLTFGVRPPEALPIVRRSNRRRLGAHVMIMLGGLGLVLIAVGAVEGVPLMMGVGAAVIPIGAVAGLRTMKKWELVHIDSERVMFRSSQGAWTEPVSSYTGVTTRVHEYSSDHGRRYEHEIVLVHRGKASRNVELSIYTTGGDRSEPAQAAATRFAELLGLPEKRL